MNLLIEKIRRLGYGFRNLDNYRLRLLLYCRVTWHTDPTPRIRRRRPRMRRRALKVLEPNRL